MLELAVGVFQCLGAENQYRRAANVGFLALVLACFFGCTCTWSVILHSDCHFYLSTHPVFDRFHAQYAKMEGEGLGNFITWSTARPSNVVTCPLNSQVIYKSDLAFCASCKDGTSTSRELH